MQSTHTWFLTSICLQAVSHKLKKDRAASGQRRVRCLRVPVGTLEGGGDTVVSEMFAGYGLSLLQCRNCTQVGLCVHRKNTSTAKIHPNTPVFSPGVSKPPSPRASCSTTK